MIRSAFPAFLALLVFSATAVPVRGDDCIPCHLEKTPGAVRQWQQSAHAGAAVGCARCHGSDHQAIDRGERRVDGAVCGGCHGEALRQHAASRHGIGLHTGWGCTRNQPGPDPAECRFCHQEGSLIPVTQVHCARFLKQTAEMRELGCNRCHQVESNCASCHGNHLTDLAIVRDPGVCAKCHMGPDHPQWEMWQTSQHGTLYAAAGPEVGPDCQRCHMPGGTHEVSQGLTATPGMAAFAPEEFTRQRAAMEKICQECHGLALVRRELGRGDAVRAQSLKLVKEAEAIIWDLADRGLLDPMPADRPPHPLAGQNLVTGGQMLYEDYSHIERLLFKMKKYDLAKAVKGAYHQNPAYTHWYGNAELKMDLVDVRAEASRLAKGAAMTLPPAAPGGAAGIERELEVLKNRFDRGGLTATEYAREKGALLEQAGRPGGSGR